jgi:hypothetical protein
MLLGDSGFYGERLNDGAMFLDLLELTPKFASRSDTFSEIAEFIPNMNNTKHR